jgi:quercetin 2,3-dioxygenase
MIKIRRDSEIYRKEGGWFSARWHFSFDDYHDPDNTGFGPLRVFNDDRLVAGAVWPMHPHQDVEGITYVLEGTFEHADSLGNGGQLQPGAVQCMTLGSGALHSERNGSQTDPMRFLQFWILPDTAGLPPENVQRQFNKTQRTDKLLKVAGPDGGDGADYLKVHQDATVHIAALSNGVMLEHQLAAGRGAYLYLIDGAIEVNGRQMAGGDAATIEGLEPVAMKGAADSELIMVEVPLEWTPVGVWARYGV